MLIRQLKKLKSQQNKEVVSIETRRGLLTILHQKKNEHLKYLDPNVQVLDEIQYSMLTKMLEEALSMYQESLKSNYLHDNL